MNITSANKMTKPNTSPPVNLRFPGNMANDANREKTVTLTAEIELKDYTYWNAVLWKIGSHGDKHEDFNPSEKLRALS